MQLKDCLNGRIRSSLSFDAKFAKFFTLLKLIFAETQYNTIQEALTAPFPEGSEGLHKNKFFKLQLKL